jgi:amino acid transporter
MQHRQPTQVPRSPTVETALERIRRVIYGQPLASDQVENTLLRKLVALPVFCSDAISSVAYGGQQILLALCMTGLWMPQSQPIYSQYTMTITWTIVALLVVVSMSYWQTIFAYPNGGGSYIVSKENLGTNAGLIAAAALLIDYVLCVSVSVASGVQNLKDVPLLAGLHLGDNLVPYCLSGIGLMALLNLRGLKEPGALFSIPVYTFITMCYAMIFVGLFGEHFGWQFHTEYANQVVPGHHGLVDAAAGGVGIAVLMRAFATGCSALTGTEAVSNGVPAFVEPRAKNAAITLVWMALILGTIFAGVSMLAVKFHIVYWEHGGFSSAAVIDQLSGTVFGKTGMWSWAYVATQVATALILLVAAQTSFADFPRVSSILARDGFMPRQLANWGDRLAFDNGIIILAIASSLFILVKKGSVDLLIPFFTIGVFLAFTLSQAGMVRHWFVCRDKNWQRKALINGLGALTTCVVLLDIVVEKFVDGAWFVVVLIVLLIFVFHKTAEHYKRVSEELHLDRFVVRRRVNNTVIVLVQGLHVGTIKALDYARSISKECVALYVEVEPGWTESLLADWQKYINDVPLVVVKSPYRSLVKPIMRYLDEFHAQRPDHCLTVIVGEFVSGQWWHSLLHGNTALILKLAFLSRRDVVVTNVRYWLSTDTPK